MIKTIRNLSIIFFCHGYSGLSFDGPMLYSAYGKCPWYSYIEMLLHGKNMMPYHFINRQDMMYTVMQYFCQKFLFTCSHFGFYYKDLKPEQTEWKCPQFQKNTWQRYKCAKKHSKTRINRFNRWNNEPLVQGDSTVIPPSWEIPAREVRIIDFSKVEIVQI